MTRNAPAFGSSGFYVTINGCQRVRFDSLRAAQKFAALARRNGERHARAKCCATGASA